MVTGRVETRHRGRRRSNGSSSIEDGQSGPTSWSAPTEPRAESAMSPASSTPGACCGDLRCGSTSTSASTSPTSCCGSAEPGRVFPGYGWLFPGPDGRANAGLGIGTMADRRAATGAVRLLPQFLEHLRRTGLIESPMDGSGPGRLGGWLKMGMVGTTPGAGRVLLTGDAAGLVNPLQGEGIAHAMTSGGPAAEAVLAGPAGAASRYRDAVARDHLDYHRVASSMHRALVGRPAAASMVGRALTHPLVGKAVAGGWSVFWNELLQGAPPGPARTVGSAAAIIGRALTRHSPPARWLDRACGPRRPDLVTGDALLRTYEASRCSAGVQCRHGWYPAPSAASALRNDTWCAGRIRRAWAHDGTQNTPVVSLPT